MANVYDKDYGFQKFVDDLANAKTINVVVGVHKGDVNNEGLAIAEYAAANEFGTADIPERSFMRSAFDESARKIVDSAGNMEKHIKDAPLDFYRLFSKIGMQMESAIKKKIGSNIQPQNSPKTIEKKGSSRTLIDTGAMLNSVRYVIRFKNEGGK